MPGSTENAIPARRGSSLPAIRYGSSCSSRPMPWPGRGMKCPPQPASTSGSGGFVGAGDQVRVLVLLQADAVAGAVDELLAVAGLDDRVAAGGVDRGGGGGRGGRAPRRAHGAPP